MYSKMKYMAKYKEMMTFRVTPEEKAIIQEYCKNTGKKQVDVFREFVRVLRNKLGKTSKT